MRHGLDEGDPIGRIARLRRDARARIALAGDLGAARHGDGVEARALTTLVAAVLPRAWRRDSAWHGEAHWRCVAATGLDARHRASTASIAGVVLCFGLLHDTRRENETYDPGHGPRAASFAASSAPRGCSSSTIARFAVLARRSGCTRTARCRSDPTIGACWDADRLHLPRVFDRARPDAVLDRTRRTVRPGSRRRRAPRARAARVGSRSLRRPSRAARAAFRARGGGGRARRGRARRHTIRHEVGTDTAHVRRHRDPSWTMPRLERRRLASRQGDQGEVSRAVHRAASADAPGWIALPVGRAETGPSIAELVGRSRPRADTSAARRCSIRATSRRCGASSSGRWRWRGFPCRREVVRHEERVDVGAVTPVVTAAMSLALEPEALVQPNRRLVPREDVELELADARAARPGDRRRRAAAVPIPRRRWLGGDDQAEIGDVRARRVRVACDRSRPTIRSPSTATNTAASGWRRTARR